MGSVFHSGDTALSTPLTTIYVITFADRCADVLWNILHLAAMLKAFHTLHFVIWSFIFSRELDVRLTHSGHMYRLSPVSSLIPLHNRTCSVCSATSLLRILHFSQVYNTNTSHNSAANTDISSTDLSQSHTVHVLTNIVSTVRPLIAFRVMYWNWTTLSLCMVSLLTFWTTRWHHYVIVWMYVE